MTGSAAVLHFELGTSVASTPLICIRCLYEAIPGANPAWRFRLPYFACVRHSTDRVGVRRQERQRRPRTKWLPPVSMERLVCGTCRQPVAGPDAVAMQGEDVVHAWCHRFLSQLTP